MALKKDEMGFLTLPGRYAGAPNTIVGKVASVDPLWIRTIEDDADLDRTYGLGAQVDTPLTETNVVGTAGTFVASATIDRNWFVAFVDTSGGSVALNIPAAGALFVPYTLQDNSGEITQDGNTLRFSNAVYGLFAIGGAISWEATDPNADVTADVVVGRNLGLPGEVSVSTPFTVGSSPTGNPRSMPTIAAGRIGPSPTGSNQVGVRLRHNQGASVTVTISNAILLCNQFATLP